VLPAYCSVSTQSCENSCAFKTLRLALSMTSWMPEVVAWWSALI
jgi:hypothetical protein